tara:strand:- start:126 stop:815 length:690 start_codon:yes stop_codon:yes gene_type:complete
MAIYNVSGAVTEQDNIYIKKILEEAGYDPQDIQNTENFDEQIQTILAIQNAAFHTTPEVELITLDTPREPENLYIATAAYCGDRARFIDKALRWAGFESRFVSIYENEPNHSFFSTMLAKADGKRGMSHALVEVKTAKGWMMVDTRKFWISLTKSGDVINLKELRRHKRGVFKWSDLSKEDKYWLLDRDYYVFYGLYSRHGRFYAPYTKYIPDVNWPEFLYYNASTLLD